MFQLLCMFVRAMLNGLAPRFAEPTLSTYGGLLRDPGYAGELVDQNPYTATSLVNDQSTAIQFGNAVARSAADNTCKAPTVDTDPILGIALRHAIMPTLGRGDGGTNLVNYPQNATVPVLREGFVFAVPVENVSRGDGVISVTAQNGALGSAANNVEPTAVGALAGSAVASGTVTMTNQAVVGDTVTMNGVVFTFIANGATPVPGLNQVALGSTKNNTATALQVALAASLNPLLTGAVYTVSGAVVTVTYLIKGVAGNAYTLATSDAGNIAVSAATLASGAANAGSGTITLGGQPTTSAAKAGVYVLTATGANAGTVVDPNGVYLGTFGSGQFNDEIVFTIGGTCTAGDSFTVTVTTNAGRVAVPNAKWETTAASGAVGVVRLYN